MTTTSTDISSIRRITSPDEAEFLGLRAYEALLEDLASLRPEQWETVTVCNPWTIADMVRHLLGAAKANASMREMMRQQLHGARNKSKFGGNALDATNDLQVSEHLSLGPAALVTELENVYAESVRTRTHRSRLFDKLHVPMDAAGSTAPGMPSRLNMGDLYRVVYTRDVWLHRIDIARALGREPEMSASVDGRLVEDVVKEWSERHGQPYDLDLAGPAGGRFHRAGTGPHMELDATQFCWILSGRGAPENGAPGASLLKHRLIF